MKKIITLIITLILIISSMGLYACGKTPPDGSGGTCLVDVNGLTTYDIKDCFVDKTKSLINAESGDVSYKLTSVATGTEFIFDSSVINLYSIYKEHYLIEAFNSNGDEIVAVETKIDSETGEESIVEIDSYVDFHDVTTDGVVWCEWSEYILGAAVSNSSKDSFDFQYFDEAVAGDETYICGYAFMYMPGKGRDFLNYVTVKPFHSKEYYQEFAPTGIIQIDFVRKAVYSFDNVEFKPYEVDTHAGHYDGELAVPGTKINFRCFGINYNQSSIGAKLNMSETVEYQMIDIVDNFEKIGDIVNGGSHTWLLGTCHYGKNNPYRISWYVTGFEIIPG